MDKKYIVTLADEYALVHKLTVPVTINGKHTAWIQTDINLTPYTEPDMEQIRKEAYEKGFDAGRMLNTGKYEKGINDAWEAARTLWNTPNRKAIFGYTTFSVTLTTLTAQEAIEKIRQYEQEKEMDGLRQNIQTIVDQCGYTLDEIAEVLQKMKES